MSVSATKPSNPKDIIGSDKLPFHLWPETATILGSLALEDGALKYGRSNFRAIGVKASIYYDAARRHLNAWFEGQDTDPDSGLPHLAHLLACVAILVDAGAHDQLNDDRQFSKNSGYLKLLAVMTPHVKRLKEKHADKSPKHYTIGDNNDGTRGLDKEPSGRPGAYYSSQRSVDRSGVEASKEVPDDHEWKGFERDPTVPEVRCSCSICRRFDGDGNEL